MHGTYNPLAYVFVRVASGWTLRANAGTEQIACYFTCCRCLNIRVLVPLTAPAILLSIKMS